MQGIRPVGARLGGAGSVEPPSTMFYLRMRGRTAVLRWSAVIRVGASLPTDDRAAPLGH